MDQSKKNYLIISYALVALISVYVATTQWIINKQLYKNYDLSLLTGEPVIEIDLNVLVMMSNTNVRTIDFRFQNELSSVDESFDYPRKKTDGTTEDITFFNTSLSDDKKWIRLKVANGATIADKIITIDFDNHSKNFSRNRYFIDTIKVDGKYVEVYDFVSKDITKTNLKLHIPRSFSNISKNIANDYGENIIEIIKFILIVLLSTQTLLYLIGFVWEPEEISNYFKNVNPDDETLIVDSISRKYSIPLGFLGTILSIWVALEINQEFLTDFNSVLEIFKGGIFTTVLGLSTNIVCILRSQRIKITKSLMETKK